MPVRLQLSRAAGFNLQELSKRTNNLEAVNCARPTIFSNPFPIGKPSGYKFQDDGDPTPLIPKLSRQMAVDLYEELADGLIRPEMHPWGHDWHLHLVKKIGGDPFSWIRSYLRGKNLACWCPLKEACHCDYLLRRANR